MIKYSFIILFSLYSGLFYGQDNSPIEDVKTILKYNPDSEFLVVLVHGSGTPDIESKVSFSQSLDCYYKKYFRKEFKLFDEVSDNLYQLGYSTLQYDKLNTRSTTDKYFDVTDNIKDVHGLLQKLKSDTLLKDKKIILFGFSEGVTVAINQLNYSLDISGIIAYGGVFMDPIQMKADVFFNKYKICDNNEKRAKSYRNQFLDQMERMEKPAVNSEKKLVLVDTLYNEDNTKLIGINNQTFSVNLGYFKNLKTEVSNSMANLSNTDTPVLLIHGGSDIKVPIENHHRLNDRYKNKKNISLKVLKESDHFMRKNFSSEINQNLFEFIGEWGTK
ncbi:alpha/beta hydrolase family protein [Psychroflexus aestuariivivens]|uniref:alpha/beta hydrolase family protein n=1 Tax=Psychroflexus aestuariivivens TaxID=1795040 RepID=UPI000FD8A721|nr:alpha/beta hydrolase [Psychroflexus aestuariivivens]